MKLWLALRCLIHESNDENEWEFCNGYAIDGEEESDETLGQTRPLAWENEEWWAGEALGTPARVLTMSK
jgi:hypothetical protein